MKRALLVTLVVVIVVTGLPLLVGMGAMACHDCGPAVAGPSCPAVVAAFSGLLIAVMVSFVRPRRRPWLSLLSAEALERPPQLI